VDSQPFETFRSSVSGRSETCPELSTVVVLSADYRPEAAIDEADAEEYVHQARGIVKQIEELIR